MCLTLSLRMFRTGWRRDWAVTEYGPDWRQCRRATHQHFRQQNVHLYHERATNSVRKLLLGLLENPDAYESLFRR